MNGKEGDTMELQTLLSPRQEEKESVESKKEDINSSEEIRNYTLWKNAAIFISCASIIFTTAFGLTFFVTSQIAKSPAAFGFAFAAVLDSFTSAIVLWRFAGIERNDSDFSEREQEKERRACIAIAICFILSSFAIASKAVYTLAVNGTPRKQYLMEILSIASLLFLIFLVGVKCLIAHKVHSRAMRTDAFNSLAGAAMTLGMIASDVVCEKNHKICYLDSVTAVLIAIALFSYGILTIAELTQSITGKEQNEE